MNAVTFDTLKYAETLEAAGIPRAQARAQATALSDVLEVNLKELATKGDIVALKTELKSDIALLKKDMQNDLQKETAPMKADIVLLKWMVGVIVAGVIALVAKAFLSI